jgi:hypothetical protein
MAVRNGRLIGEIKGLDANLRQKASDMKWTRSDHLDLANRHVLQGKARCARQRVLIEEMVATGQDTTEAENLLKQLKQTLGLTRGDQQRLLQESQTRS